MEKKQKLSSGQKAIVTVGAFVITFITVCTFLKSDIKFLLTSRSVERKYGQTTENSLFVEDNFEYVKNYTKSEVNSREDIINASKSAIENKDSFIIRFIALQVAAVSLSNLDKSIFENSRLIFNSARKYEFAIIVLPPGILSTKVLEYLSSNELL